MRPTSSAWASRPRTRKWLEREGALSVKDWLKIVTATALIGLFSADIGTRAAFWFGAPLRSDTGVAQKSFPPGSGSQSPSTSSTDYTPIVVGFLTLAVMAYQTRVFHRQAEIADRQTTIGASQLDIAADQVEISRQQHGVMAQQTEILEKQKEIMRQSEMVAHRPKLSVRNVVIKADIRHWPNSADMILGEMLNGQIYIVNRGGYEAQITDILVEIYQTDKEYLPMERPYEGKRGYGNMSSPLLAGQSTPFSFRLNEPISNDVRSRIIEGKDGKRLYVMGWIEYRDGRYDIRSDTQLTRRTAFCRLFNPKTQRFIRVEDEDYEFEE